MDEDELLHLSKVVKGRNRRRALIVSAIAFIILGGLGYTGWYVYNDLLGEMQTSQGEAFPNANVVIPEEPEDPNFEALHDIEDATTLNGFLRDWWNNGGEESIRYSRDVLNVLLIGQDMNTEGGGPGRSDTMMLCSINKKAKKITLVSFLRDSYAYMNLNGLEHYHRINASLVYGGPAGVMETISHLYKIRVDKYATVDFQSFPKLIDALGGVEVAVEEQEAGYINRTAPSMKRQFPFGERVKLNGKQALVYSRIRKLDSDLARAARQQKVIASMIQSARGASKRQLYRALDQTMPYVVTNYTRGQILGLLPQALNWPGFAMTKASYPILEGEALNAVTGIISGMQLLIVDYPLAAQQLQIALYGESNINLENNDSRDDYIRSLFRGTQSYQNRPSSSYSNTTQPQTEWEAPTEPATEAPGWKFWKKKTDPTEAPTAATDPATETATETATDPAEPEISIPTQAE
jgi:LCP family protein required for cell wall assembly